MAIKETIPFGFNDIYSKVENKFIENGYDIQEGSNNMQLVTAMSYLISMLNANTAVNINENILTLARKRPNILQDSRLLGYEPQNKLSYVYELEIKLPIGDFILPKYTKFSSNGLDYYYVGDYIQLTNTTPDNSIKIDVKEGNLIKSSESSSLNIITQEITENGKQISQYYIDIPYTDVEDDGIECFLTYYDDDGILVNKEKWTKLDYFNIDADTILNKQFYRLNRIELDLPRIYFKLPNTGKNIRLGTKVEINVLQSSGINGVMSEIPTNNINLEVLTFKLKKQGTEEESINDIKVNAPMFWNSANRAVTLNDYLSICNRLTAIDKSFIWDGNDEYPKEKGKIWFSFLSSSRTRTFVKNAFNTYYELDKIDDEENWFVENQEITEIFNYIEKYKIPTLELIHRHPVFLDFEFDIDIIKYNIANSESEQNQIIFDIINNYFYSDETNDIEGFNVEFFLSNLIKRIDTQITDITGVNVFLKNNITLYDKYIVNEIDKKMIIPLGIPYDSIYDIEGNLLSYNLPNIETPNFIGGNTLTVDTSSLIGNERNNFVTELDILLGSNVIGKYKIFKELILVEINIDGVIVTEANISQKVLSVEYINKNIQAVKNTLPRLKQINFI